MKKSIKPKIKIRILFEKKLLKEVISIKTVIRTERIINMLLLKLAMSDFPVKVSAKIASIGEKTPTIPKRIVALSLITGFKKNTVLNRKKEYKNHCSRKKQAYFFWKKRTTKKY